MTFVKCQQNTINEMKQPKQTTHPLPKKAAKMTAFDKIEKFCSSKQNIIIIVSCLLALIFSVLLFNPDVSVGGDDSEYIRGSYNFVHGIAFPSWQGPLYPIFLAPLIAIFGINIVILKFLSAICWVASVYFTYKLLVKISNYTIASAISIITSVSLLLNSYASTTYSEPFFMLLQALFLGYLIGLLQKDGSLTTFAPNCSKKLLLKSIIPQTFILALLSYALYQTRSVAIVTIPFALIVLLFEKKFLLTSLYFGWTAIIHLLNNLYRSVVWDTTSVSFNGQLNKAFLKNFYKASDGTEDFMGLVQRFWDNSQLYLSKHLAKMSGFLPFNQSQISTSLTIFIYLLVIVAFIILWKKHKRSCYSIIYASFMIGSTFILLQKTWDQERLIMIYYPLILGFVLFALYRLFSNGPLAKMQWIPIMLTAILFISTTAQTTAYLLTTYKIEHRFSSGRYESYTQDWQNYMLASKWAEKNLPDTSVVICRKSQMSWIASGGSNIFKGITRVPTTNPDTLIMNLKEMGATHVIMGNLRINPNIKTDRTINTVRNTLYYITTKLPAAFKLVKSFGKDEQAYVFEVNFNPNPDYETLINNLDAALIINPHNLGICLTKAEYFYNKNEFDNGLSYINFALKINPKESQLYFAQGLGYFNKQDWGKAAEAFSNCIQYNATNSDAWYNKAVALYNQNKPKEAKEALAEAKRLGHKGDINFEKMLNNL